VPGQWAERSGQWLRPRVPGAFIQGVGGKAAGHRELHPSQVLAAGRGAGGVGGCIAVYEGLFVRSVRGSWPFVKRKPVWHAEGKKRLLNHEAPVWVDSRLMGSPIDAARQLQHVERGVWVVRGPGPVSH
jgi:hypothetical protein